MRCEFRKKRRKRNILSYRKTGSEKQKRNLGSELRVNRVARERPLARLLQLRDRHRFLVPSETKSTPKARILRREYLRDPSDPPCRKAMNRGGSSCFLRVSQTLLRKSNFSAEKSQALLTYGGTASKLKFSHNLISSNSLGIRMKGTSLSAKLKLKAIVYEIRDTTPVPCPECGSLRCVHVNDGPCYYCLKCGRDRTKEEFPSWRVDKSRAQGIGQ